MKVNFFDRECVIESFSKLYNITVGNLIPLCFKANMQDNPELYFIKQHPVSLDMVDISDVELHCKHITTSIDRMNSLNKYGFLTLDKALTSETSINKFLNDRGVVFDVKTRRIFYDGKEIILVERDEECQECFYGTECQYMKSWFSDHETLGYRDLACPYRKAIKITRSKLFHDKGEIEVHLSGSFSDIHDYSEVKYNPEILNTIERMINKLFENKVRLVNDWRELTGRKYYCLDFDVNIRDFEYITTSPQNDKFWYNQFLDFCSKDYYSLDGVNQNFYGNLYLLGVGIQVICCETPVRYGQIKNEVIIPTHNIDITEYKIE